MAKNIIISIIISFITILFSASPVFAERNADDQFNFIYDRKVISKDGMKLRITTYCDNGELYKLVNGYPIQVMTGKYGGSGPSQCMKGIMKDPEENYDK